MIHYQIWKKMINTNRFIFIIFKTFIINWSIIKAEKINEYIMIFSFLNLLLYFIIYQVSQVILIEFILEFSILFIILKYDPENNILIHMSSLLYISLSPIKLVPI